MEKVSAKENCLPLVRDESKNSISYRDRVRDKNDILQMIPFVDFFFCLTTIISPLVHETSCGIVRSLDAVLPLRRGFVENHSAATRTKIWRSCSGPHSRFHNFSEEEISRDEKQPERGLHASSCATLAPHSCFRSTLRAPRPPSVRLRCHFRDRFPRRRKTAFPHITCFPSLTIHNFALVFYTRAPLSVQVSADSLRVQRSW